VKRKERGYKGENIKHLINNLYNMREITIKQALAQGYKYCGHNGQERLDDVDTDQESLKSMLEQGEVFLAEKEPKTLTIYGTFDFFENIIENSELCEADQDTLQSDLKAEFGEELEKVLEKMRHFKTNTYEMTDIKLKLG
jgi:hypothetical protein